MKFEFYLTELNTCSSLLTRMQCVIIIGKLAGSALKSVLFSSEKKVRQLSVPVQAENISMIFGQPLLLLLKR
jgi:hypothetical protein